MQQFYIFITLFFTLYMYDSYMILYEDRTNINKILMIFKKRILTDILDEKDRVRVWT